MPKNTNSVIKIKSIPMIGIVCDVNNNGLHHFHGVGEKYINAVANGANVFPVLIPAQGPGEDLEAIEQQMIVENFIANISGLFLAGSPSNVSPKLYGDELSVTPNDHDPQRDSMTMLLIKTAIEKKIPILAVCRGMQEINVALGGSLHQKIHDLPAMMDHRENKTLDRNGQYADAHSVQLVKGGMLEKMANANTVKVNSLHGQGINQLADVLVAEAHAPDGLVEAFSLDSEEQFLLAVQWHPEWKFKESIFSSAIFKIFGDAVRAY